MTLNIKLKRSSTKDSAPSSAQLEDGELGVNYNADSLRLYVKDSDGTIRTIAGKDSESSYWNLSGTDLSPTDNTYGVNIGADKVRLFANGTGSFTGKVTSASTVGADGGTTLATKDYVDAQVGSEDFWDRSGTTLSPTNSGDNLDDLGSITAAGNIMSGAIDGGSTTASGSRLYSSGEVLLQTPGTYSGNVFSVLKGTTETSSIQADGSITAAGGKFIVSSGGQIDNEGYTRNKRFATYSGLSYQLNGANYSFASWNKDNTSDIKFAVDLSGAVTAAGGKFIVESTGQFTFEPEADAGKISSTYSGGVDNSTSLIGKDKSGTETFRLKADGTITAGGTTSAPNITLKGSDGSIKAVGDNFEVANSSGKVYTFLKNTGETGAYINSAAPGVIGITSNGSEVGTADNPIKLNGANGSITGEGDGVFGPNSAGNSGLNESAVYLGATGYATIYKKDTSTSNFFNCRRFGVADPVFTVSYEGAATFKGPITGTFNTWDSTQSITFGDAAADTAKGIKVGKTSSPDNFYVTAAGNVSAPNITTFRSTLRTALQSAGDLAAVKTAILDALDELVPQN